MEEHQVPAYVKHKHVPEIKAIDVDERTVTHVISNDRIDRGGDIVEPGGWNLADFKKNPVVLADHDYKIGSIIGRAEKVEQTKSGLLTTTRFDDVGLGNHAFRLISEGFLKAFSVGFKPIKAHSVRAGSMKKCAKCVRARDLQVEGMSEQEAESVWIRGTHFEEQELLEYSAVAIPMNPDAVLQAVQAGLDREAVPAFFSADGNPEGIEQLITNILAASPASERRARKSEPDPRARDIYGILGALERDEELKRAVSSLEA